MTLSIVGGRSTRYVPDAVTVLPAESLAVHSRSFHPSGSVATPFTDDPTRHVVQAVKGSHEPLLVHSMDGHGRSSVAKT